MALNKNWRGMDLNQRPRAYESPDLRSTPHTPICGIYRGYFTFLPRYGGMLSSNNPMLMIISKSWEGD